MPGQFQTTKIGLAQQNYTGAAKQSFANGAPGVGVELSIDQGGAFFRYFFKTRIMYANGSQVFTNSGVDYATKYTYTSIEPEIGFTFYPVSRNDKGMNLYGWGVVGVSYNNLSLETIPTYLTLQPKEQEFGTGYGGGLGFEYIYNVTKDGKKLMGYGEVGFRDYHSPLAGFKSFQIGGMIFSFGFGF